MDKKYLSKENVMGKQVIDSTAVIVGDVKDMSFDLTSMSVALTVTTKAAKEIIIEGENITAVGDVILLNKPFKIPTPFNPEETQTNEKPQESSKPPNPSIPGLCSMCGYQNAVDSKFCIKCGHKL